MSSCIAKHERNSVLLIVIALIIFLLYDFYSKTFISFFSSDSLLLIHILLEFLSIAICFVITILGCVIYPLTKSRYIFMFSVLFFYVGIFDGFHTLSFSGMPFDLNPDAATWFWTIARIVEATGITLIFTKPDKAINIQPLKPVAIFLIVIGIVVSVSWYRSVVFLPTVLPASPNLPTECRSNVEYIISLLRTITLVIVVYRYRFAKSLAGIYIIQGVILALIGELIYVIYNNDSDPIIYHIYKVAGYFYFLKGIYFTTIRDYFNNRKSAEERFTILFHTNPCMMAIVTLAGKYVDVNKAFQENTGMSRDDIINGTISSVNLGDGGSIAVKLRQIMRDHRQIRNEEIHYVTNSHERKTAYMSADIIDFGINKCALITLTDITERRCLEREWLRLERLNLIGQMAASIGHEIRNPLTTVRGYLQLFQRRKDSITMTDAAAVMIEELDRANTIITEFLTMAKNKRSEFSKANINEIITGLLPLLSTNFDQKGRTIQTELGVIAEIPLDTREIRQVILNLVKNAIEATDCGGTITIRTSQVNQEVILTVENDGKKIPPEVLDKLGTPFFTTKDTGMGMGLAICYSIVARHKAKLIVESTDTATKFDIRFDY
ncbi:MASE3 domain-containing protein [Sporomusa termitida]|uniref:histidine kinase n=1 Tax=Sporomusa termitida TaxID=2377 RepID=A0A517DZV8_9FIRM|nr:MASE3 domain-containing protein [Sporomusa termitida]QDR82890.1 Adaptive-response sensory-kinase SasA [Sporomusa termitida]